jgi:BirA family transcriptional regulator, biotin operon repressor / biotin---[acetyl-CoA-carboxylase] ligase
MMALPADARVISLDTTGSTNADALDQARRGEQGPLWITARRQTGGRGRRRRLWVSEPGNLFATLLLTDPAPPHRAAELSFVAALAVHDAVRSLSPGLAQRLALKWPNDCLIDGRKFAGILIEGEGSAVAIGIGINCAHHPDDTGYPATDLAAAGIGVTAGAVFEGLWQAMNERIAQWNRGAGFAVIRDEWLKRAANLGRTIRIGLPDGMLEGRFETIDSTGRMVLRLADGSSQAVTAGEVLPMPAEV